MSRRLPHCLVVLGLAATARIGAAESVGDERSVTAPVHTATPPATPIRHARQTRWDGLTPSVDAEQELGERLLELLPRRDVIAGPDAGALDPYYRMAAFAQLTAGGRGGGDVGVGASAAHAGANCDLVAGKVHGRFRPFDDDGAAAGEASYSACLSEVLLTLRFDGRRGAGIVNGLDARRSLWNRAYDSSYDRIKFAVGEFWDEGSPHRHTIASVALGHGTTTQHDDLDVRTIKELDLELALYRYRHRAGLTVEALTMTIDAKKAGDDDRGAVTNAFMPVRVRVETPAMYVAARGGWGWTGGHVTASGSSTTTVDGQMVASSSWSDTINSDGLPQVSDLVGDLEAGVRRGRLLASANLSRAFFPTFDGNLAREARISAAVSYLAGSTELTLSPFAIRNHTWTRDRGSSRDVSVGASVHVGRALTQRSSGTGFEQLRLDMIGEAGVSPYARPDGERLSPSTFGGRVLVAVSGTVAR
jgi:hypothetical protein